MEINLDSELSYKTISDKNSEISFVKPSLNLKSIFEKNKKQMKINLNKDSERSLDKSSYRNHSRNKKINLQKLKSSQSTTNIKIDKKFEYSFGTYISNLLQNNNNTNTIFKIKK
jgi:biopolymer transport protein ExbD